MRNVIVTGGSRGLGLSIARKLAQAGYQVIAVARKENDEFASVVHDVENQKTGSLKFVSCDLSDISKLAGLVRTIRKELGPIYGLVNNAGIGTSGILAMMPNSQIEEVVRLNTLSPIVLTKYVVRVMMSDGGGRIVNVSSIVGFTGYTGLSVYAATKASLIGFTKSLAREVGSKGVNINTVAPGFLDTAMTEQLGEEQRQRIERRSALHRLAGVDDVADTVEFLLGEKSRNITGTAITVDAGNTA